MSRTAQHPGGLTDVAPLAVGHHTDARRPTGSTVILCGPDGAVAGVDVRGAAPGTRETDLLSPMNTVERVHAVLLAGGSAYGLDAAGGVMRWLDEHGIGLPVGPARVPIVPAAILFDLWFGDAQIRPDAASVGAGAGAAIGKIFGFDRASKGGIGSASLQVDGITVAALVALNAIGDVIDPRTGQVLAGARGDDNRPLNIVQALLTGRTPFKPMRAPDAPGLQGTATTLAVLATDAVLSKAEANKLAQIGHDGLARTINPVHTPHDGDTVFALATGHAGRSLPLATLGVMAAQAVADAVVDAVYEATAWPGYEAWPAWRDLPR
jgi:L-aminopeptidase/D-esterase-like protein